MRPPVDEDWVLAPSRAESEPTRAARIHDLLAPFEKARAEREASGATSPLPPPPSSARLPDAPPRTPAAGKGGVSGAAPVDGEDGAGLAGDDVSAPAERVSLLREGAALPAPPRPDVPPVPATPLRTTTSRTRADGAPPQRTEPPVAQAAAPPAVTEGQQAHRSHVSAPAEDPGPVLPGRPDTVPAVRPRSAPDASPTGSVAPKGTRPATGTSRTGDAPPVSREETTTRLRPVPDESHDPRAVAARRAVGAVDLSPGPGAGRPFVAFARPAVYDDTTTRLRPIGTWARPRAAAAVVCVVLGLGLIGGAATGSWLTGESVAGGTTRSAYTVTGALWHSVPVDRLFPPELKGEGAGPGGADRSWTRIAVAPDSGCTDAFDPLLSKVLAPVGCLRLLRATYADATRSHVTTVGLLFTKADADAMQTLRNRFTEEGLDRRPDLMPRAYAAKGTAAEGFGDAQRASWTMSVLPDAPVVAYAVSGFADGRAVTDPEPATEAMGSNTTSAPAQSGLGHEAKGIADRVERGLRKTIAAAEKSS
ncbi:hypothetical protein [Streptomyces venezuelae]|uniref:hypothetical protein n=1 Tax=Streptomyces venezuelae TaxID=54571 RepID=UPI002958C0FA|nr:hypothetical protein [Streptomyces venezuelae]